MALGTLALAGQTASLDFTWNFLQQQLRSLQQGAAVHLASQPASHPAPFFSRLGLIKNFGPSRSKHTPKSMNPILLS